MVPLLNPDARLFVIFIVIGDKLFNGHRHGRCLRIGSCNVQLQACILYRLVSGRSEGCNVRVILPEIGEVLYQGFYSGRTEKDNNIVIAGGEVRQVAAYGPVHDGFCIIDLVPVKLIRNIILVLIR